MLSLEPVFGLFILGYGRNMGVYVGGYVNIKGHLYEETCLA